MTLKTIAEQAAEPQPQHGIILEQFENIFQFGNPSYYKSGVSNTKMTPIITMVANMMTQFGAQFYTDFQSGCPNIIDFHVAGGRNDSIITYFTYNTHDGADSKPIKRCVVAIGTLKPEKKGGALSKFNPVYLFLGEIDICEGEPDAVFPVQVCSLFDATKAILANNIHEVVQSICFAREATEQVLSGESLSFPEMRKWLITDTTDMTDDDLDDFLGNVAAHYNSLTSTTAADFNSALKARQIMRQRTMAGTAFIIAGPTGVQ